MKGLVTQILIMGKRTDVEESSWTLRRNCVNRRVAPRLAGRQPLTEWFTNFTRRLYIRAFQFPHDVRVRDACNLQVVARKSANYADENWRQEEH